MDRGWPPQPRTIGRSDPYPVRVIHIRGCVDEKDGLPPGEQLLNAAVADNERDHPRPTVDLLRADRQGRRAIGEHPTVAFAFLYERRENLGCVSGRRRYERAEHGTLAVHDYRRAVAHNLVVELRVGRDYVAERLVLKYLGILSAARSTHSDNDYRHRNLNETSWEYVQRRGWCTRCRSGSEPT